MKASFTDAELAAACRAYRDHGTYEKAAFALGISQTAVSHKIAVAKHRGLTADSPVRDPLEKAREENSRLKAELRQVHRQNDSAEEIRKEIFRLKEIPYEPPGWLDKPIAATKDIPGIPMMLWSDWHAGETVRKGEVGGLNVFGKKIFDERVRVLVERCLHLVRLRMPKGKPGAVVCLGGDLMTGGIHQELLETNDEYVLETVRHLKSVLLTALTAIAEELGPVYVPCVVGNHGRNTVKPRAKGIVYTSYEWSIYTDLEDRLKNDKRFRFTVADETDVLFSVQGHRFLLTHGDRLGTKGGDGIIGSLGPIVRGEFKVRNSESKVGRDFDTILMGHWHEYHTAHGRIVNNCLKGYDEFARTVLRANPAPASQALWFVHRKYGIHSHQEVFVQDPSVFTARGQKPTGKWVEVFAK
ncbi:MAG: hypothetical protein KGJ13_07145 [Patescibacteria group bacterium]|nr:hypothetical protein [Patescibacteria group bacterium]